MARSEYEVRVALRLLDLIEALDAEEQFATHLCANTLLVQAQREVDASLRGQSDDTWLQARNTPA